NSIVHYNRRAVFRRWPIDCRYRNPVFSLKFAAEKSLTNLPCVIPRKALSLQLALHWLHCDQKLPFPGSDGRSNIALFCMVANLIAQAEVHLTTPFEAPDSL
ncbi:MAG: hypothetical protein WBF42_06375, partial [Terracidiphilus sp.]